MKFLEMQPCQTNYTVCIRFKAKNMTEYYNRNNGCLLVLLTSKYKNWTIDTRCLQLSQDPNLLLFNHTTKCIQQDTNELN